MKKLKDPASALSHLLGILLAIPATVILVLHGMHNNSPLQVLAFLIYGLTMIGLYTASTVYHSVKGPYAVSEFLRKIDHMMIFVYIAGSYTPICLLVLKGTWGITILCIIWAIAIGGILLKIFWMNAPRFLYTGIYIAMGWVVIVAIYPLSQVMSEISMFWLVAGGIVYTLGGIIYATKWPPLKSEWFGFHEVFHLFILGGSICHMMMMFTF